MSRRGLFFPPLRRNKERALAPKTRNEEREKDMNIFKRVSMLALALALALSLASCASGPDMPMEVTVNDHTIALGQTTTGDMAGWGWQVDFTGSQNEIYEDAKYVACHFRIKTEEGSGHEFWVSVYVPFQKNIKGDYVDFSAEEKQSRTEGVVYRVSLRKDAGENIKFTYNGADYHSLTWEDVEAWGAKPTERSSEYSPIYELEAAQGTLKFQKGYTGQDEPGEFAVTMNTNAFAKLQK